MGDPIRIGPAASANTRREGVELCRASHVLRRHSQALITAAHEALERAGRAVAHSGRVKVRQAAASGGGVRRSRMLRSGTGLPGRGSLASATRAKPGLA